MQSTAELQRERALAAWLTPIELFVLGAIWGGSFILQRIAAPDFGPAPLVALRLVLGGLVLAPFLWQARTRFAPGTTPTRGLLLWGWLLLIGLVNSAIPFLLFAWGAERAPAGVGAITNAMAVPFTALIAAAFFGEQITVRRAVGLLAGFAGVAVLASGKMAGASFGPAVLAGTLAAVFYGFGGNLVRRHLAGLPPLAIASATITVAGLALVPLSIATWPRTSPPAWSWACTVLLGVLCTGIAYALYFRLIQRVGAPRAAMVTYVIPLFGVLWAWVFLKEPLTVSMLLAGGLILGGVALGQGGAQRAPKP